MSQPILVPVPFEKIPPEMMLSPAIFATVASRRAWRMAHHLAWLDRQILNLLRGNNAPLLVVEAPPRHGKSEFLAKYVPAWFLLTHPHRSVLFASATERLARRSSSAVRSLVREWGGRFGTGIKAGADRELDWQTEQGGGFAGCGIGGDIIGRGGHLLIIDDYLKNAEAAFSERVRDKQWDWWQSTFSTRLEPEGVGILLATRWHEDDLIGRLVNAAEQGTGLPVNRVSLPAIAIDDDPLARTPGEALWPEQWPLGSETEPVRNDFGNRVVGLRMREQMLDDYWWNCLYQQRPIRGGLTEWPDEYFGDHLLTERWPNEFILSAIAVDPSRGDHDGKGDFTAIVFVGLAADNTLHVDALIKRLSTPDLCVELLKKTRQHRPTLIGLETNQFQALLAPEIQRTFLEANEPVPHIIPIHNSINKRLRIMRLGGLLKTGRLKLWRGGTDSERLLSQLKDFPRARHDDGPDALEMAVRLLNDYQGASAFNDGLSNNLLG